jgi:IclR family pca regulon transcriptional regulator
METPKNTRYFIRSLAKGLSVLQTFAEVGRPITLSELAQALGTTNATATRLCYTLTELGFIRRDGQKRYHLTPKVLTLGYPDICSLDWQDIARYYLECLFEAVQETVNLSILEGPEILYLIRVRKRKYLPFDIWIGTRLPVYCTAMGKVLMAMGPPEKTRPILEGMEFRPLTAYTIMDMDRFVGEIKTVLKKGYAVNDEELSIGNRAVAAPVLDEQGHAVAAINIAVPTSQYSRIELEENLAPHVVRVAGQISNALHRAEAPLVVSRQP